jgi:mersacidin/lichenicidin family type 2 lantibiotic
MAGVSNNGGNPISEFYQRMALDSIIKLVHTLSYNYTEQPFRYEGVSENVHVILTDFRYREGTDPDLPNALQRYKIYDGLLGKSFWRICKSLRRGAVIFSEQGSGKGENILRRYIEDELVTLRAYLKTIDEPSVHISERQIRTIFEKAVTVLRSPEIARVIGLRPITEKGWPLEGVFSSIGAKLVEEISRKFSNRPETVLPLDKFLNIQRAAYYGKLTISGVLDTGEILDNSDNTDKIIGHAYRWTKALYNLVPMNTDITIRTWKDPAFRRSLTTIERSILPEHPSGQIDLSKTELPSTKEGGEVFQSETNGGICCSTPGCSNGSGIWCCGGPGGSIAVVVEEEGYRRC